MSPIKITPVNTVALQQKSGILSNYAKKFIKYQIKSTSFALERFFTETGLISQNEQKLKELGIKQIGKNPQEGVIISDKKYNYHVFSSNDGYLGFNIFKPDSNEVYQRFSVNDKNDNYYYSGNFPELNVEDEISKVLDLVSGKLYDAKRECTPDKIPVPFIQNKTTSDKIEKANRVLRSTVNRVNNKDIGFIGTKENELIESINEKFLLIQNLYKEIKDCRTRWEVKKSYPNYFPQPVANKLGFKNTGPNGESVSLFKTSCKKNAHTVITITDTEGKETIFAISQESGTVQKNLPSVSVNSGISEYRIFTTPDYYTQKELDELNPGSYLSCFNEEMEQFIKYTKNRFVEKAKKQLIHSNQNAAILEPYKELLSDIKSNFDEYRTKMRKYLRKSHKNKVFKTENNISTKLASIAVKFDNITTDGCDLRLSYPKVHDKTATQLLVMRDDKIINSFYIINNKLLRFNIKDLNDKITRYDRNMYYYDNEYLQNSNLHDYLILIQNKLHELNKKLDIIRQKQIENRIKYHIKSSAD